MRMRYAAVLAGLLVGLTSGEASAASFTVTYSQTAAGVLGIGSGDFATDQLTFYTNQSPGAGVIPSVGYFGFSNSFGDEYKGTFTGPSSFGDGSGKRASSYTGDLVSFAHDFQDIYVPNGYSSGTALSATELFSGATFASLGMTPGTYTWTYGGLSEVPLLLRAEFVDPFASTITVQVGSTLSTVPLPASAPMFGAALLALSAVGYGVKRKKAAAAA